MLGSTWHFGGHWILSILVNRLWCHWRHTHTRLTALCLGLPRWAGTRKVKPIWILLKQETVSGSGISWAICKSAPHSTPATHHSVFYRPDALPAAQPTTSKHCKRQTPRESLMLQEWKYVTVSCLSSAEDISVFTWELTKSFHCLAQHLRILLCVERCKWFDGAVALQWCQVYNSQVYTRMNLIYNNRRNAEHL